MHTRFQDTGETIYSFMDKFLVICPKCHGCAQILLIDSFNKDWLAPRRLSCMGCGLTKDWHKKKIERLRRGLDIVDDYFYLPLWLQIPCNGEILWAYNERHLEFIEGYVSAKQRQRRQSEKYGWMNASMFSRLPQWMKSAKNRDMILHSIKKLQEKLS